MPINNSTFDVFLGENVVKQLMDRIGRVSLIGVMCLMTWVAVCGAASRPPVSQRTTRTRRNAKPAASPAKSIEMAQAAEQEGDLLSAERLYRRAGSQSDVDRIRSTFGSQTHGIRIVGDMSVKAPSDTKDADLAVLKNYPNILKLNLGYCTNLTDAAMPHVLNLPRLQELNLVFCKKITDQGILTLMGQTHNARIRSIPGRVRPTRPVKSIKPKVGSNRPISKPKSNDNTSQNQPLPGLTRIRVLNLRSCEKITDRSVSALAQLTNLNELDLTNCELLTDKSMAALTNHTRLQSLMISGCRKITNQGLKSVGQLTRLTLLELHDCVLITDAGIAELNPLTKLKHLGFIRIPKVTNDVYQTIGTFKQLEFLYATHVSDSGLMHIRNLSKLKTLIFTVSGVTNQGFIAFGTMPNLTTLGVLGPCVVTDSAMSNLAGLTKLTSLSLPQCNQLTDAGLAHLAGMKDLEHLDLQRIGRMTSQTLDLIQQFRLISLNLSATNITDQDLQKLTVFTDLQHLHLEECQNITDAGLVHLATLKNLATINLGDCPQITPQGINQLHQALPSTIIHQ